MSATAQKLTPQQVAQRAADRKADQELAAKAAVQAAREKNSKARFPLKPLMDLLVRDLGSNVAGQRKLRVSGSSLIHARQYGLSWAKADEWATKAGYHPVEVWGKRWYDDFDLRAVSAADTRADLRRETGRKPAVDPQTAVVAALSEAMDIARARRLVMAGIDGDPTDEQLADAELDSLVDQADRLVDA